MRHNNRTPLFLILVYLFWFSLYPYVSGLTPYAIDPSGMAASGLMAGLISGSYGFVQMILRFPGGILSDKLGKRRPFIVLGVFLALASALGMHFAKSAFALLIMRGLSGAAAASWVMMTALYLSYFDQEHAARRVGVLSLFNNMGQVSAMLLGGVILNSFGQRSTFVLAAAAGLVALLLSFFTIETKPKQSSSDRVDIKRVLRSRHLWHVSILAVILQTITFGTVFGFTPEIANLLGASGFELGLLSTLAVLPGILASYICSTKLPKKIGINICCAFSFALVAAACIATPTLKTIPTLMAWQVVSGLGRGLSLPLLMGESVADTPSEERASVMGFFQSVYGLGMFIGPVIVGFLRDTFSLATGYYTMAGISALGLMLSIPLGILVRKPKS